jgi:hypothetical protein
MSTRNIRKKKIKKKNNNNNKAVVCKDRRVLLREMVQLVTIYGSNSLRTRDIGPSHPIFSTLPTGSFSIVPNQESEYDVL